MKPLVLVAESCPKRSQWSRAPGFQQERGFNLFLGPIYVSAVPALFFFYPNAQFAAPLRLGKKAHAWYHPVWCPEAFSWEQRLLFSRAAELALSLLLKHLQKLLGVLVAGGFGEQVSMWGALADTAQIPPEVSGCFWNLHLEFWESSMKPRLDAHNLVFPFLPASHLVCTLQPCFFICYLGQTLSFSHAVHFCILWLLSSTFQGWFIWKAAAFRLRIWCSRSEVITRQAVLSLNWNSAHDPFFVILNTPVASPSFVFSFSC